MFLTAWDWFFALPIGYVEELALLKRNDSRFLQRLFGSQQYRMEVAASALRIAEGLRNRLPYRLTFYVRTSIDELKKRNEML